MSFLLAGIVLSPLCSSALIGLVYMYAITQKPVSKLWFTIPALSAPLLSFIFGMMLFLEMASTPQVFIYKPYMWLSLDTYDVYMGFLGDSFLFLWCYLSHLWVG